MDSQVERTLLQLPQRTLRALTFCETDVNSVHQWLSELPKADKVRSAKKLVQALDELTRLNVAPSLHWSLIEQCRPVVYYLVQQIQKQLLNNLVTFSDEQQEDYSVCLQLLLRLLTAYKVIVQSSSDTTAPGSPLAAALHRALADSASTLLVTYEFYPPCSCSTMAGDACTLPSGG